MELTIGQNQLQYNDCFLHSTYIFVSTFLVTWAAYNYLKKAKRVGLFGQINQII